MAIPVLLAAAARVVGMEAAKKLLKKGGQKALESVAKQAGKAKKLAKKPTEGQKKIEQATKSQRAYAKGQAKAGAAATAVTGASYEVLNATKGEAAEPNGKPDGRTNSEDYPTYKKKSESGASFRKAFAKAKKDGKKTFEFEGRKYSTQTKKK